MNDAANKSAFPKLFIMMILQFCIWGAWLPLIWDYIGGKVADGGLGFNDSQSALIGSTFAIASVLAIFFSNQFADRNFAAEKFLAFSHLIGGATILALYWVTSFPMFFVLMLIHSIFYVPTISVANTLAFSNISDASKEFGLVRMGGTIGWIMVAWPLYFILQGKQGAEAMQASKAIFIVSGIASLALAAFSLTLPHTPPKPASGEDRFAWLRSGKKLLLPFVLVLFIVTFIDATIHNGYFLMAGGFLEKAIGFEKAQVMPIMSLGQVAEIITMAILGLVLKRLGWKLTLLIGILGHAARYSVFAFFGSPDYWLLIIIVQVLHGICYAFFFATVYIFIDAVFPKDVRSSAQGWFNLLILGLGDLAAKWFFLPLQKKLLEEQGVAGYKTLFLYPTFMALGAAVLLLIAFFPPKSVDTEAGPVAAPH